VLSVSSHLLQTFITYKMHTLKPRTHQTCGKFLQVTLQLNKSNVWCYPLCSDGHNK